MNRRDAQKIIALCRPGGTDADDPAVAAALDFARRDPELQPWLEERLAGHAALRDKFREIPVPPGLKDAILARHPIVRPPFWSRPPAWLAAAAVLVALLGLAAFWMLRPAPPDRLVNYQEYVVQTVLRRYGMEIKTKDQNELRRFLDARGGPAEYEVAPGLQQLTLTGGGLLRWRGNPVSMICFDRGDQQMLFLFVMEGTALKDAPPPVPQPAQVNQLTTVSWSRNGKVYVLAGEESAASLRQRL